MRTLNQFKNYSYLFVSITLFLMLNADLNAQTGENGIPRSFSEKNIKAINEIPYVAMPSFDFSEVLREDSVYGSGVRPFRFA